MQTDVCLPEVYKAFDPRHKHTSAQKVCFVLFVCLSVTQLFVVLFFQQEISIQEHVDKIISFPPTLYNWVIARTGQPEQQQKKKTEKSWLNQHLNS